MLKSNISEAEFEELKIKEPISYKYLTLFSELSKTEYLDYYKGLELRLHGKKAHEHHYALKGEFFYEPLKFKIHYDLEKLFNKNIEKYGMYINRKPEVDLIDNLNTLGDKLYNNNELTNFKFKAFQNFECLNDLITKEIVKENAGDIDEYTKEKDIIKDNPDIINEIESHTLPNWIYFDLPKVQKLDYQNNENKKNSFLNILNKLSAIYFSKKYHDCSNEEENQKEMLDEMKYYGKKIYLASNNLMVNGKILDIFSDEFVLNKFKELPIDRHKYLLLNLISPVDSKSIYMQAINKIVSDFLEKDEKNNSIKYIYNNGKLGKNNNIKEGLSEEFLNKKLKKALQWKINDVEYSSTIGPEYLLDFYNLLPDMQSDISMFDSEIIELKKEFDNNVSLLKKFLSLE